MNQHREPERRAQELLREPTWIGPLDPIDLMAVSRGVVRARRLRGVVTGATVAVAAVAALAAVSILKNGPAEPPTAAGPSPVQWSPTRPAGTEPPRARACDPGSLSVSLGQTGAWHGQSSQSIFVRTTSRQQCVLDALPRMTATANNGKRVLVDSKRFQTSDVLVERDQATELVIGSPAECGAPNNIANRIEVAFGDVSTTLDGARVLLDCGSPSVVVVDAPEPEPPTINVPLVASIRASDQVTAGTTLVFIVDLTNGGEEGIEFTECPEYSMGLKQAAVSESYVLNCREHQRLPAGSTTSYEMRLDVPSGFSGPDDLTWALLGYPAVASTAVNVLGTTG